MFAKPQGFYPAAQEIPGYQQGEQEEHDAFCLRNSWIISSARWIRRSRNPSVVRQYGARMLVFLDSALPDNRIAA
jgi:hypothetical protein